MGMQIAARLLDERKRLKMNQTDFALAGGVVLRTYVNYEKKGHPLPDASFFQGIHKAGADVFYIITGQKAPLAAMAPLAHYSLDVGTALQSLQDALNAGISAGKIGVEQIRAMELLARAMV